MDGPISTGCRCQWLGAELLIAYIWVHYATTVVGVTLYVMAAFAMAGDPVDNTIIYRMLDTTIAAALVVCAAWIDQRLQQGMHVGN